MLFLDEPTSGLDGTASLKLIKMLHTLCREGRTIVTTIHQPRAEIMELFDSLLLLKSGKVAYFGPAERAVSFIDGAGGKPYQEGESPGDYIIDVIGLNTESYLDDHVDLPAAYSQSSEYTDIIAQIEATVEGRSSFVGAPNEADNEVGVSLLRASDDALSNSVQSTFKTGRRVQTWVLIGRRLQRIAAKPATMIIELGQVTVVAFVLEP